MDLGLSGAVAIVTGGGRGLGAAITRALVSEGMLVLAVGRDETGLVRLREELGASVAGYQWTEASPEAGAGLVDRALQLWGRVDVVVNNAGFADGARFVDTDSNRWRAIFEANVLTPMGLTRAVLDPFVAQGSGSIINIASTSGIRGKPLLTAYSASKAALIRFTEALATEIAATGVRVNAVAPGAFATDAQASVINDPTSYERRLRKIPAGRMGEVDEIGPLVAYLASPLSSFVTGSTFVIDGGEVVKL